MFNTVKRFLTGVVYHKTCAAFGGGQPARMACSQDLSTWCLQCHTGGSVTGEGVG